MMELEYDGKLAFNDCHEEGSDKAGNALSRPFPIPDWHIMHPDKEFLLFCRNHELSCFNFFTSKWTSLPLHLIIVLFK